ncbi:hypothetical protein EC973_005824 [Apophysomyces ossiformis]|uniref:Uncharacterized protein n=1 Tax=Apophysomyces ossiformis TaxID=679940 RepID=A0A8H7BU07_9FUNG|nr:hypothetical protein EC973_005824 [Apophysomyces ossiformis]
MYFWESPAVQATGLNGYMFLGALIASTCSTGALHYLLSPYINTIHLHTSAKRATATLQDQPLITPNTVITLETLDLLARRRQTTLALRDLKPSTGLFSTWRVSQQLIDKQYELERLKGIKPALKQTKFWLDQKGEADTKAMEGIIRVIQENDRRQRLV